MGQAQSDTTAMPPNPPVSVELLAGTRYISTQLLVRKKLGPTSRLAFFNVTTTNGSYRNERPQNEFLSLSYLCVVLVDGLSLAPGIVINSITGFRPTVGLQYVMSKPVWTVVVLPRIDLRDEYNVELFSILEYKPVVSTSTRLYSRLQLLYNTATQPTAHNRSYLLGRLGVTRKHITGGVSVNSDVYGPEYRLNVSYGLFIRADLFN